MEVIERTFIYGKADEYHLYPFGDMHMGTQHCYEPGIVKQRDIIKNDPLAYWWDVGDSCEFITPSDPRWDGGGIAKWVEADNIATSQVNHYVEMMQPIANKCIGKNGGNHEDAIRIHNSDNVQKNICDRLDVPNLGYAAFIKLIFHRKNSRESHSYTIFTTHGSGCAITAGAKLVRLQRLMDNFDADIVAHGHVHDILTYTKPYLKLNDNNEVKQRVKVGAMTGCWFRTYTQGVPSSYGERKNYPPVMMGCPRFTIIPDKDVVRVEG